MDIRITQLDSLHRVEIDGVAIRNVANYQLSVSQDEVELTLTIKYTNDISEFGLTTNPTEPKSKEKNRHKFNLSALIDDSTSPHHLD